MTKALEPELVSHQQFSNPSLRVVRPYQPGKPISEVQREPGLTGLVKLASNENPLGPSPLTIAAMQELLAETTSFPGLSQQRMRREYLERTRRHA